VAGSTVEYAGVEQAQVAPPQEEGSTACSQILSTVHRVHGREKQMLLQEQCIESSSQKRSDSTWDRSGAKEKLTSGLSFIDALKRPCCKSWQDGALSEHGMGALSTLGWGIKHRS
jgi:hypothetical protein